LDGTYLIGSLGTMIVAAAILVMLFRKLKVPSIIIYIIVGLLTEPMLSRIVPLLTGQAATVQGPGIPDTIQIIGKVGIVLLLFLVGLELSLEKIREIGKVAVYAGIGQVVFTAIGGFFICLLLRFSIHESIFLATALTFSSTVVVIRLLDQKKEMDTLYGRIAVGILLAQDLVVMVALTFLAGLGNPKAPEMGSVGLNFLKAFLGMGALLGLALLSSRYLLIRPFQWACRVPEMLFIWSLGWCFGFVVLAELLGLSLELGAFLAGLSLAQLRASRDLRRRIHPLMNFFVAVFFISLGAQMELEAVRWLWAPAAWLSLFVLIGKPLISMVIITRCGYSAKVSFLTSAAIAQISEFSFIFATLGLRTGLIQESILSLIALVGIVTIAFSSYMFSYNQEIHGRVARLGLLKIFRAGPEEIEPQSAILRDHVIVVGLNTMGRRIVQELDSRGQTVLSIDRDPAKLDKVPGHKDLGDIEYMSVMETAQASGARLAVTTLRIEDANNVFAFRCKQLGIPVAVHAFDSSISDELQRLGVDYLIDSKRSSCGELLREIEKAGA
jgi:Kef-type K+ transport system membrane component KefB